MTYYIKKPSILNSSVEMYYIGASKGFARWSDKFDDRKATKLILKRAKKNPFLYSQGEIMYAKKVKNQLKKDALSHQETK